MKGLYIPYLRWSILFILLHNFLCNIHLLGSKTYHASDYLTHFVKLVTMTDFEIMIRPFWFIKELLLTSIIVATLSLICSRIFPRVNTILLLVIALAFSISTKHFPTTTLIGDCSLLFFCITYFYSGVLIHKYKKKIPAQYSVFLLLFIIILIGSSTYSGTIDMRFTTTNTIIPYYILSIVGIIMVLCISKIIENYPSKKYLYYIGNHTMPILALNLIALKFGNLIKIWIYDFPIERLSDHTVIGDNNTYFWLIYTIIGITIPLLIDFLYTKFVIRH